MIDEFDQVFAEASDATAKAQHLRKTLLQRFTFWGANILFTPLIALCYLTIGAEGLRACMGIFSLKIYRLPVPGLGLLRNFDGWDRLELSHLAVLLLFAAVAFAWYRGFSVLMNADNFTEKWQRNPVLFCALAAIFAIIVAGDAAIFFFGLEAKAGNSWGETPAYIAPAATLIYMSCLAGLGAWHADYHHSGIV